MEYSEFKRQLEKIMNLIENNMTAHAIDRTKFLIESCYNMDENHKRHFHEYCVLMKAKLSRLTDLQIKGMIDPSDYNSQGMLNFSIIVLLRKIEDQYFTINPALERKKKFDLPAFIPQISTKTNKWGIEIILNRDYKTFTIEEQEIFLNKLGTMLSTNKGDIIIKNIGQGSVRINLEMPQQKIMDLMFAMLSDKHSLGKVLYVGPGIVITHENIQEAQRLEKLFEDCKQGDEKAIAELYKYYLGKLLGIAYKYILDRDLAYDIVHDVFLKMLEGYKFQQIKGNIGGYLMRAVKNQSLTIVKRLKKAPQGVGTLEDKWVKKLFSSENPGPELMEREKVLQRMTSILSKEQMAVLRMSGQGYKGKEIAEILSKTLVNIRQIRYQAWKVLKNDYLIRDLLEY